jgi:hypothetical protein
MSWLSFDDGYTRESVWDDVPYDSRWLYHAVVETCCAERRYDGRLRWTAVLRCSDVPDPARSAKELIGAGLLADLGGVLEVGHIDNFLPPEGQRDENLLNRKRTNQRVYRRRKCDRGEHTKDCPAATCPVKLARAVEKVKRDQANARAQEALDAAEEERVAKRVTGNAGTGRDGSR